MIVVGLLALAIVVGIVTAYIPLIQQNERMRREIYHLDDELQKQTEISKQLHAQIEALRNDPTRSQQILARIPAGRWGDVEDFKGAAVYLASDAAAYVHGTVMLVDGGWMGR